MKKTNEESGWRCFLELCLEIKTIKELDVFFNLFLTIEERNDVADRCLIIKDLLKGEKTQREIARDLRVSIAKITRGSNGLKMISDDLRNFLIKRKK